MVVAAAATGCGGPAAVTRTEGGFTDGGVRVSAVIERAGAGALDVTVTLRPQQAGFHLYSLDLPDGGIDGLGIPTRVSVTGGLSPDGPATTATASQLLRPAGLDVALPVYPDGPVTLRLAAHRAGGASRSARLTLTYGACSERYGCRPPVREHALDLPLPSP